MQLHHDVETPRTQSTQWLRSTVLMTQSLSKCIHTKMHIPIDSPGRHRISCWWRIFKKIIGFFNFYLIFYDFFFKSAKADFFSRLRKACVRCKIDACNFMPEITLHLNKIQPYLIQRYTTSNRHLPSKTIQTTKTCKKVFLADERFRDLSTKKATEHELMQTCNHFQWKCCLDNIT